MSLAPAFAVIHAAAYWLRFEGRWEVVEQFNMTASLAAAMAVKLVVFGWFGIYQGWNRYVTFHDLVALVKASTVSALILALLDYLIVPGASVPRSVFLMDWGVTLVVVGGLRSIVRVIEEQARGTLSLADAAPVLIVGANPAGEALLRGIRRNPSLPYCVKGFITQNPAHLQSHISGVPVIGLLDDTCQLAKQQNVSEVLITAGELSGRQIRRLMDEGVRRQVSVKVLPSYEQLLQGDLDLRPRRVSIEDLLRRDPVQLNLRELHAWIDDRVLLVTGSAGSIGSEICRQLLQFAPRKLVAVDRSENGQFFLQRELKSLAPDHNVEVCLADVADRERLDDLFRQHRPHIVFHAAAYKHVPLMEANIGEAVKNITLATRVTAELAHRHGAGSFVLISTDKAVNPTSVMGACKRLAELYVQALAQVAQYDRSSPSGPQATTSCRFVTVRFGNVLDSAGSVVPIFREQIARGGPVTVTHPQMTRYFMTIPEASQLVIQAGAMGQGGEIFVLDMGEPVRIVDLAKDMIRLSGLQVGEDIEIECIGIRPGEKLHEELHIHGERHIETSHPKIMVAESLRTPHLDELTHLFAKLRRWADVDNARLLAEICRFVPAFTEVGRFGQADSEMRRRAA